MSVRVQQGMWRRKFRRWMALSRKQPSIKQSFCVAYINWSYMNNGVSTNGFKGTNPTTHKPTPTTTLSPTHIPWYLSSFRWLLPEIDEQTDRQTLVALKYDCCCCCYGLLLRAFMSKLRAWLQEQYDHTIRCRACTILVQADWLVRSSQRTQRHSYKSASYMRPHWTLFWELNDDCLGSWSTNASGPNISSYCNLPTPASLQFHLPLSCASSATS